MNIFSFIQCFFTEKNKKRFVFHIFDLTIWKTSIIFVISTTSQHKNFLWTKKLSLNKNSIVGFCLSVINGLKKAFFFVQFEWDGEKTQWLQEKPDKQEIEKSVLFFTINTDDVVSLFIFCLQFKSFVVLFLFVLN